MDPAGKVIVVTGGAAGMGEAMCRRFAALGASVVVADIDAPRTAMVAEQIGGLGFVADVADETQVIGLVNETLRRLGRIDVFVSNAGVLWGEPHDGATPLHERGNPWASNAAWQRVWDVNVMPQVYAARAVLPHMLERGIGVPDPERFGGGPADRAGERALRHQQARGAGPDRMVVDSLRRQRDSGVLHCRRGRPYRHAARRPGRMVRGGRCDRA